MATIKKSTTNPDKYYVIENGKKVLNGKSFFKETAKKIAEARTRLNIKKMALRKKAAAKRKPTAKRKTTGGIAGYVRKIQNTPAVKTQTNAIKLLEKKITAAKKKKAAAVKIARKKLK
jgi:hypothetical protein